MQEKPNLVSIIVPAYNAASFIEETIQSIFAQTYSNWELIIVDDGSTDNTAAFCNLLTDKRITIIRQQNAGVATARNNGLLNAKGTFVVFFDADDLMSPEFLSIRVQTLENDKHLGYAAGLVETFPLSIKTQKAAIADPVNEILFFNPDFSTVPSNYLFRKQILTDNKITFNKELSSSADRFFIIEVAKVAVGKNINSGEGKLLYRFTSQSMSNKVTPGLIIDNEKFYYELKRKNLLPDGMKRKFKSFYFFSLAKGFGMVNYRKMVVKYLMMSFINHPILFVKTLRRSFLKFYSLRAS